MTNFTNHNQPKEAYEYSANVLLAPLGYRIEFTGGVSHVDQDTGNITVDPTTAKLVKLSTPVPPPVIEPPGPTPPPGVRVIYVAEWGNDTDPGTEGKPVRTVEQVKRMVHPEMYGGSERNIWVGFERGGMYEGFHETKTIQPDGESAGRMRWIRGEDPDHPFVLFAWGAGSNPILVAHQFDAWRMNGGAYVTWHNIDVYGQGASLGIRTAAPIHGLNLHNCDFVGARIEAMSGSDPAKRFVGLGLYGVSVRDLILPVGSSAKMSGLFCEGVDGIDIDGCLFDRCGWNRDTDGTLIPDKHNHGNYIAGTCGPATVNNSVYTRNAGAGLQMRSGGSLTDTYIGDNALAAFQVGWMRTSNMDSYPPAAVECVVSNVVAHHSDGGAAVRIGNIGAGLIDGLTILSEGEDWSDALHLDALNNGNVHGLTNLAVRNVAARSVRNAILLTGNDWDGVNVTGNKLDGAQDDIHEWAGQEDGTNTVFDDPQGGLTRTNNTHADLSGLENVTVTDDWLDPVLSGETTGADLVKQYGAHE